MYTIMADRHPGRGGIFAPVRDWLAPCLAICAHCVQLCFGLLQLQFPAPAAHDDDFQSLLVMDLL